MTTKKHTKTKTNSKTKMTTHMFRCCLFCFSFASGCCFVVFGIPTCLISGATGTYHQLFHPEKLISGKEHAAMVLSVICPSRYFSRRSSKQVVAYRQTSCSCVFCFVSCFRCSAPLQTTISFVQRFSFFCPSKLLHTGTVIVR